MECTTFRVAQQYCDQFLTENVEIRKALDCMVLIPAWIFEFMIVAAGEQFKDIW